jgi:hypothetical protein
MTNPIHSFRIFAGIIFDVGDSPGNLLNKNYLCVVVDAVGGLSSQDIVLQLLAVGGLVGGAVVHLGGHDGDLVGEAGAHLVGYHEDQVRVGDHLNDERPAEKMIKNSYESKDKIGRR